jgi:hypothetical protein
MGAELPRLAELNVRFPDRLPGRAMVELGRNW